MMTNTTWMWLWMILSGPAVYVMYRFLHYWYRVITVDIAEGKEFFEANDTRFVLGIYGHTSFLDTPFYISAGMKLGYMACMANADYKWMYPWFTRRYLHFIVPGGASTRVDGPRVMCICVEGTRKRMDHLKRGYYYLAKNTGRRICFSVMDYKRNVFRVSGVVDAGDDMNATLEPLLTLVQDMDVVDYARYPGSVGPISLPE